MRVVETFCITALLLAGLAFGVYAKDQPEADGNPIGEVFHAITQEDGYLTQEMHARFWTALNKALASDPAEIKQFWEIMALKPSIASSAYNYEATRSCELSLDERRIIYTPNYAKAKADLLAAFRDKSDLSKIKDAIETWENNVKKFADRKVKRSAKNVRDAHYVIEKEKSAAAGPLYLFRVLKDQTFSKPVVERTYRTVPVTVAWPGEFTTTHLQPRKSLEIGMLNNMIGPTALVKIMYYNMGPFSKKQRKGIMQKLARGVLKEFGITDAKLTFETWRDRQSVIAHGSGTHKGIPTEMNVRFLSSPVGRGYVALYTLVFENSADPKALRERLEEAVSFVR